MNKINEHIPPAVRARLADIIEKFKEVDTKPLYFWLVRRLDPVAVNEYESLIVVTADENAARQTKPVNEAGEPVAWAANKLVMLHVERLRLAENGLTEGQVLLVNQIV